VKGKAFDVTPPLNRNPNPACEHYLWELITDIQGGLIIKTDNWGKGIITQTSCVVF
jgi:hypothetical protein